MQNQIVLYLLGIGVKPYYKGFNYLVSALEYTMKSMLHIPIIKIYNIVAGKYGVSPEQVERCIRTLINTLCKTMSPPAHKYKNGEFIYLCTMNLNVSCGRAYEHWNDASYY